MNVTCRGPRAIRGPGEPRARRRAERESEQRERGEFRAGDVRPREREAEDDGVTGHVRGERARVEEGEGVHASGGEAEQKQEDVAHAGSQIRGACGLREPIFAGGRPFACFARGFFC